MPSIAVVKAEAGHAKYGPISLVFSKDTIDPQLFRGNKVYGGDGWTPTAPQVEYPVNSKKLFAVEQEFHKLSKDLSVANGIFGNSSTLRSMGVDEASGKSAAELAKALAQTDTIRAAYLASQGKTLEPVKQAKVWDRYGNATLQKFIDQAGPQRLAEMEAELELGRSAEDALGSDAGVIDKILRDYSYSSEADVGDIQERLQSLYDFIASGSDGENELSYSEARRRAEGIARTVVENAAARESLGESYQELLDYLKTTKIVFGKELQRDIPDYSNFRRRQRGRLNLSSEGRSNMDQVYQELSERWPEFFDEQEQIHPADQLLRIAEVLDQLHSIAEYNPFEGEMDQTVAGAANEILERFFDLPQTRKTFADRQAAKLNAAKANDRPLHTGWGTGHRERDKGLCHIGLPLSHTVPQLPGSSRHI